MPHELHCNRREALRHLSAGTLLALGLWPGATPADASSRSGSYGFVVINDTHYVGADCGRWLEGVVRHMKTHAPFDFCLHAGDLTDNGRRVDFETVRDIFKGLGVPLYVVIGNHDYLNQKFAATETLAEPKLVLPARSPKDERPLPRPVVRPAAPLQFDRRPYEQSFPRQLNYRFEHRGWQWLGLDTTMGTAYTNTTIQSHTLRYVDDQLSKLDRKRPLAILTHFPLGATVQNRPVNADALLERFKPFNLQAVFSGHWHGFTERQFAAATLTTNKCCSLKSGNHDGTKEKGYFICTAAEGRIHRTFVVTLMNSPIKL